MHFPLIRRRLLLLSLPLTLLVLSACGSPTAAPPAAVTLDGVVTPVTGVPPILGAALIFIDVSAEVGTSSVTEILENVYMGPLAPVGADGSFSIQYPEGSELPAGLLSPVQESVLNVTEFPSCSLVASDPAVMATTSLFELATVPGIGLVTASGTVLAVATADALPETPLDEDLFAARFQTWVYASGPTSLATEPAPCVGAAPEDLALSVSATLTEGWNQLEWSVETDDLGDPQGISLGNSTAEELHVLPAFPLGSP
ncbi:MAG: hypothetical protein WDA03_05275 [Trueperaceae bacterium]